MKNLSLFLVFSFVFIFSVRAQENNVDVSSDGKNWFVGAGVQGDVYVNHDPLHYAKAWGKPSLAGDVFVGKWFSHKVGARFLFEGGSLHPFFNKNAVMLDENYVLGRLDFLLNLTNCWRAYSPDHFYNLIPHVGIGGAYKFNTTWSDYDAGKDRGSFVFGAGLLNTFRLSNHVSAFIDLKLDAVNANFDESKSDKSKVFDSPNSFNGIAGASIGLIYNFGTTAKKVIIPPPPVVVEPTPEPPAPAPAPKVEPAPVPAPVQAPAPAPFLDNVFFGLNKAIVDPNQEIHVKNAADFLNANPDAKINVVGYADKQTGNASYNLKLSQRRAENVVKLLVTKYKINSNRIITTWKGDTVQPFKVNDQNRVVILTQ